MRSTQDHGLSDADVLRAEMVATLQDEGVIASAPVASAFNTVARHHFAPDEPLEAVYHPNLPLVTKRRDDGTALSSLSAAHIQAVMLEQAQVKTGMNVLEIGSGGFNAALLAELVGADGRVTSVDIDPDIVTRARIALKTAGYEQVNVVCADAEYGVREHGPYDRIIVTVASDDVPPAWIDQLVEDGRIVVPLRFAGLTRCIAFDRYSGGLTSDSYRLGGFVPMQGHGAFEDHLVPINGEIGLRISQPHEELDVVALRKAVHSPRIERWSGAAFDLPDELELFLVTSEPHAPMLYVGQSLVEQGVFAPSALRRAGAGRWRQLRVPHEAGQRPGRRL
jgi:protein-L-isoaspartate(D-aspartate) O-methyltransferase